MKNEKQKPGKFITRLPHETFEAVEESNNVKDRVKILQDNATFALKTILQVNFREDITFDFPEGAPPYKKDEGVLGQQVQSIEKAIKQLKHIVSQNKRVDKIKKEKILIRLLETVYYKDAEVLIAMKDKDLKSLYKNLTLSTVKKAFPTLKLTAE
jgi:hypothetical protein